MQSAAKKIKLIIDYYILCLRHQSWQVFVFEHLVVVGHIFQHDFIHLLFVFLPIGLHIAEAVTDTILRRMHDYVHYITPQFSRTHINFQRVPLVDTSNPFIARDIPTPDESLIVIRFREHRKHNFPHLLQMIDNSFMSRPNTIVVPGPKMGFAMEIILTPIIEEMVENNRKLK